MAFISTSVSAQENSSAQVNSWINPASGNWDQASSWSLGVLPGNAQTVMITNSGWKAVAINPTTPVNFPDSMTVSNLTVSAPSNSLSTLLLNYAGTATPLRVLDGCMLGTNGMLANFESSFEVDSANGGNLFVDGGTFVQEGGLTAVNGAVFVPNGNFNATNASLTLGQLTVGSGTGSPNPYTPDAVFTQDGGNIAAQSIDIEQGGTYHLVSGVLYGINGTACTGSPFVQYGGTNYGDITTRGSYYWLRGGMVQGNVLTAANGSGMTQDGGLLDMKFINVTGTTNWPVLAGSWFNGGTVHCGTLNIGGNGKVEMRGADFFITNNFDLHGDEFNVGDQGPLIEHVACNMWAGNVYLPSMSLGNYASFFQDGGSNEISGGLSISAGEYTLAGGTLETTYTGVGAAATFAHGGGQHFVHGVLSITGTYTLTGGTRSGGCTLICEGLYLRGTLEMTMGFDGREFDPAATFTNTGVLNLGGKLSTELPQIEAGQVQLATNAFIDLSASFPAVIRFQNSSAVDWTAGALLLITNWSSSDHLFAGNDASGLTASQLQQVEFANPAGFAPGTYPAQILSTGEIVPQQGSSTPGLVNSWINPTSGNWDEAANWSLGVLPDSSQSVMITNSGWKAVALNPSTPVNFPNSMTVTNLTIRGATNTENVLLLNSFGTDVPLTVLNGLTLQDDGRIVNFNSGLVVQGGTMVVTNSQMSQDGGLVRTTNAPMYLQRAEYNLTNGVFEGGTVYLGLPVSARFNQYGGAAVISNLAFGRNPSTGAGGNFALYGGYLNLPNGLTLYGDAGSSSSYFQSGGSNQTTQVTIEAGFEGNTPGFTLNGGLLADTGVSIVGDGFGGPTIYQNGGTHVVSNSVAIAGGAENGNTPLQGTYELNGGTLFAGSINLDGDPGPAAFIQINGITQAGQINAAGYWFAAKTSTYLTLSGGTLTCSDLSSIDGGYINQSGGVLVASSLLSFGGYRVPEGPPPIYTKYTFTGGTLMASNINVGGDWIIGDGSSNRISNPGFLSLSHTVQISNAVEQLGRFILATNATIDLAGSASKLSFANSSGQNWAGGATLVIADWNGDPSGGGAEQLKFGTNQSGLTAAQLSQIRFGSGTNLYPAKILNTGEVVPDQTVVGPSVAFSQQGNNLVLTWPSGWSLQSATNAVGPYLDLPAAASPYTIDTTQAPQQFFRLRQ